MATGTTTPVGDPNDWQPVQQPNDWQNVSVDLHAKAGFPTTQGPPLAPTPGFFSRTAEALGIPTSMDQLPQPSAAEVLGGPAVTAGKMLYGYGKNIVNGITEPIPPEDQARYAAHPYSEIPDVASKFILEKLLAPVGGQAVSNIANDKGNLGAQAGDVAGTIGNVAMMRMAKEPKTAARIAYATGGDAKDVLTAEKDLMDAVGTHGVPKDLPELNDRIDKAKNALNTEAANALGPIANQQIMPNTISQKILALITPNMDMTQPGRILKKQIQSAALEFQKPWTLAQLDQERMDANARLHSFEKKESIDQYAATRGNNRTAAIDRAIANGVRADVYPLMDQAVGKPAGYFADVKNRIGALMNLESDSKTQLAKLNTKSLAMEGASPLERMRMRGMVGESGKPRLYVTDVLGKSDPLDLANSRVAGAFGGPLQGGARAAALVSALRKAAPNHPLLNPEQ